MNQIQEKVYNFYISLPSSPEVTSKSFLNNEYFKGREMQKLIEEHYEGEDKEEFIREYMNDSRRVFLLARLFGAEEIS